MRFKSGCFAQPGLPEMLGWLPGEVESGKRVSLMDSTLRDILIMTLFGGAVILSLKVGEWLLASPATGFAVMAVLFFIGVGLRRKSAATRQA